MPSPTSLGLIRHEDIIQPFILHQSVVRGRMVRLSPSIDTILNRHPYHPLVKKIMAEMLTLAAMLSTNLQEGGILTLQVKGDGPVSYIVVDAVPDGGLRGYASIHEGGNELIERLARENKEINLNSVLGEGYLAITLDLGFGDPYQGIVPLEGESMTEAVSNYFTQSQQIDVMFHLAVSERTEGTGEHMWAAGGIMLERMPDEGGHSDKPPHHDAHDIGDHKGWEYNALLVDTATEEELLDPHLAPSALLYRLFNEGGVWVHDTKPVSANCRCSRKKVENILTQMHYDTLQEMFVDGTINMTCQFCNTEQIFTPEEIDALHGKNA